MIGSTRSSTKRRTLSRTARSSSLSWLSMSKKSSMVEWYRVVSFVSRGMAADAARARRASFVARERTACRRGDAHLARLGAKRPPVIDGVSGLVLPLVHHLVQQRVQRFLPPVPPQVPPADRDLRRLARGAYGVVPQPAPHAPRYADRNGLQTVVKMPGVVLCMTARQLRGEPLVLGTRALSAGTGGHTLHWMRDDRALRGAALGSRTSLHEEDDRSQHLRRCI